MLQHDGLTEKDGWFVEQVEITNMNTKKTWLFKCGQWFSLHHTDGQIARTLHSVVSAVTGKLPLATYYEYVTVSYC